MTARLAALACPALACRSLACPALACIVLLVTACSSSEGSSSANLVPIDPVPTAAAAPADPNGPTEPDAPTAAPASPAEPTNSSPADAEGFESATAAYDSFLQLRAQAITRQVELDELEGVATPTAIDQVLELRTANDALIAEDSYAVLSDLLEWSNVTEIGQADDRLVFTDCTERQYRTPGGGTVVRFVTNDVTMVDDGGALKVDDVTVVQDGVITLSPEEFGCVPPSFAERAEATARAAVQTANELFAEPTTALESDLPSVFVDDARDQLEIALQTLTTQGLSRTADETITYEVLGIDVYKPEFTVVVAVCRTYPNGRAYTDSTGAATVPDLPAGSSYEEWVYVQLETVPSGNEPTDAAVEVADRGPNCSKADAG